MSTRAVAIVARHFQHHRELLGIEGVVRDPVLVFGYQEVRDSDAGGSPPFREGEDLAAVLTAMGAHTIDVLDLFDARANLRHDMNLPVHRSWHGRYATVIDIGSLEHVFDTRQCMENVFRMLRIGGHHVLQTPVNGYFAHGLHVFSPETILSAHEANGFSVRHRRYTTAGGEPVGHPAGGGDVLLWLVARKDRDAGRFVAPQQSYWQAFYAEPHRARRRALQEAYWDSVGTL